jgi:hypothetical protein
MGIFEVFYQPGKLFSSLETRRAAWVAPLFLGLLLSLATTVLAIRTIGMETIIRQQIQNNSRLSPEQMQQALNQANSPIILYVSYISPLVVGIFAILLISGLLTIFALIGSKQPKFGTNFSMVALAFFPYTVVAAVMTTLVLYTAPDRSVLDIQNLLATNVGAYMDKETTSKGLYALLSSIDILSFAEIGLLSYGFAKVNRTSISFGLFAVLSLWVIWVLIKMGLSLLS